MSHTDTHARLRARAAPGAGRVGFIELFFDLVFVFAVTQISHLLLANLTLEGAAQTAFMLLALWIAWMWTTWATNWLNCETTGARLMLIALMALGLVMAAALPRAFGDKGLVFAVALAAFHSLRTLYTVFALSAGPKNEQRNFIRIEIWLLISGGLWIAGGLHEGAARWAYWSAALALEFAGPWWRFWVPGLGASRIEDWRVDPHHMAERCGLFIIIALGESVILIGATFADVTWSIAQIGAFAAAFIGAAAMWWIYFATGEEEAREAFALHPDPGRLARAAYTYAHIPMVAGIVVYAVGAELALAHPEQVAEVATILVLLGGPALFLFGTAWFSRAISGATPLSHLVAFGLIGAVAIFSPQWPALALGIEASLILTIVAAWEGIENARARRAEIANSEPVS